LAEPAFVFPTRRSNKNSFGGQLRRLLFYLFAVEGHVCDSESNSQIILDKKGKQTKIEL